MKQRLDVLMVLSQFNVNYNPQYDHLKRHYDNLLRCKKNRNFEDRIEKSDCKIRLEKTSISQIECDWIESIKSKDTKKTIWHQNFICEVTLEIANNSMIIQ